MNRRLGVALLAVAVLAVLGWRPARMFHRIPAFARKYRTSCTTCHTAPPKLNTMGEAFRLNGYRFPENDRLLRKNEPVPLGEEPWKDLWPRAIWPSELPDVAPLALRLINDVQIAERNGGGYTYDFRFPHEVYLLAATTLGETFSVFLETEWSRERGIEVLQAKVKIQDPIPGLPRRAANLWIGQQNLYLFTFADRQIDRAAREIFAWQQFRVSDLELRDGATGTLFRSEDAFQLRRPGPAIEINGLAGSRLYYGFGLAQGAGELTSDNNDHKDVYYKLRFKIGGIGLDGTYDGPLHARGGQLLDRSVIFEHFGYFGQEPGAGGRQDTHRSLGAAVRLLYGPTDVGVGYVHRAHTDPWGADVGLEQDALFAKGEFMLFPWLLGSLKYDRLSVSLGPGGGGLSGNGLGIDARVMPGVIALIRQNARLTIEAILGDQRQTPTVWIRSEVAF